MQQNYIDYIQLKWTKKDLEWTKTIKVKKFQNEMTNWNIGSLK